jgi:hypothetical protein
MNAAGATAATDNSDVASSVPVLVSSHGTVCKGRLAQSTRFGIR